MDPIGKYNAWITLNGLRLTTKQESGPIRQIELTPDEALALLQAGYSLASSSPCFTPLAVSLSQLPNALPVGKHTNRL